MNHLYFMKPETLYGDVIYPFNKIKEMNPDVYEKKLSERGGHDHTADQYIPTLQCLWGDVLRFFPVDPLEIRKALDEVGIRTRPISFYKIASNMLKPELATILLFQHKNKDEKMKHENFAAYDSNALRQFSKVPKATKDYYEKKYIKGEKPLLFIGIPHILYKGSLNISRLAEITV